ncbi:hypothetical protein CMT76_16560 [Elizabethkingia anophelis]|nr:hypothetical protein [Elizabethkingia anophelis]
MMKNIQKTTILAVASSFLLMNSCRSNDTENTLIASGTSAVNIQFSGTDFADETGSAQASVGKSGIVANTIQSRSVLVDPSHVLTVQYAPATNALKTSAGINGMAAVDGNAMTPGTKFRILAYNGNNTTAESQSDYTVGASGAITGAPLMLTNGATYTIVAYSYGSSYLPPITNNIQSVPYDNTPGNRDLMYQKLTFQPNGNNGVNTITIKLRHVTTQITTIIDAASYGSGNITNIQNAKITPHYTNGNLALASGTITGPGTNTTNALTGLSTIDPNGVPLVFPNLSTPNLVQTANPIMINANQRGTFSADIALNNGPLKNVGLPDSFLIKPGYRRNLTIKLARCGANILGKDRNFMCHNLGADYTVNPDPTDPTTDKAKLHGAKYQWGAPTETVSMEQDQSAAIVTYSSNGNVTSGWDKPGGLNNPCPEGYRMPTSQELGSLFGYNGVDNQYNTSTFTGTPWVPGINNYGNFRTITSKNNPAYSISLPAAGYRQGSGTSIQNRGFLGWYWTATNSTYLQIQGTKDGLTLNGVYPGGSGVAMSVRCISDQ